mmetsp:Transcript_66473/g.184047  ORF Transcript_66473/g.184047 Transcript_66473/m.184047 type:complete len:146 (+) Transcript_66473:58-495(+)
MGNAYGYPSDVPPGGTLLHIQDGQGCCPMKPSFPHSKPAMVAISDVDWGRFHGKVEGACGQMKDEKVSLLPMLLIPLVIILSFVLRFALPEGGFLAQVGFFPFAILAALAFMGLRYWISPRTRRRMSSFSRHARNWPMPQTIKLP